MYTNDIFWVIKSLNNQITSFECPVKPFMICFFYSQSQYWNDLTDEKVLTLEKSVWLDGFWFTFPDFLSFFSQTTHMDFYVKGEYVQLVFLGPGLDLIAPPKGYTNLPLE